MMMQVNQEVCTGCGICVETYLNNAIALVDGKARIDSERCTLCTACEDACPNGAISMVDLSREIIPATTLRVEQEKHITDSPSPSRSLTPWVGAALTFLGREVAPRLLDVLMNTLEQRQMRSLPQPNQRMAITPRRKTVAMCPARVGRANRYRRRRGRTGKFSPG